MELRNFPVKFFQLLYPMDDLTFFFTVLGYNSKNFTFPLNIVICDSNHVQ